MATWYCNDVGLPYIDGWRSTEHTGAVPYLLWRCSDVELPYKQGWEEIPEVVKPYPALLWLCNDVELPWKSMWRSTIYHVPATEQDEYITVHDMATAQDDFEDNGLAILDPTSCEISEELNGAYELTLTHPIDSTGKWKQLLEMNIIKARGQLFRIYNKTTKLNSDGSRERTVNARHIFYDLNGRLLEDSRPTDKSGHDFIDYIMNDTFDSDPEGHYTAYDYTYTSDITETATAYFQGVSPVAALMGEDNCFINRFGGELLRDNFYFSVNQRRESSKDHTETITYGIDMLEVEETVDYTDMCTYLKCYDNFGNGWFVSYIPTVRLAHDVCKEVRFNYEVSDMGQLRKDGQSYFDSVCVPHVSYTVVFANLKNVELYKDFINLQNYNIGDTVNIYCEELDITTNQKIVKKTVDAITNNTISIELGASRSSLTRKDKFGNTIAKNTAEHKENLALKEELRLTKLKLMRTWGNADYFTWGEAEQFTWEEVQGV